MKHFKVLASHLLYVFGALWLIVEAISFFISSEASGKVKSFWWLFLLAGLVIARDPCSTI